MYILKYLIFGCIRVLELPLTFGVEDRELEFGGKDQLRTS